MTRTLDDIASDYELSEITILWIHDRNAKRHFLLYAVAEMCPVEQPSSTPLQDHNGTNIFPMIRLSLDANRTIYATRLFSSNPRNAIDFFRGISGRRISIPPAPDCNDTSKNDSPIIIECMGSLTDEPENEYPILLTSDAIALAAGLPKRSTALRVLSKYDVPGITRNSFTASELEVISGFSIKLFGINLQDYAEHLGAIHLCFANPIIRYFQESLTEDERGLIFEIFPRQGKSIEGCRLVLIDERQNGIGFHVQHNVHSRVEYVALPTNPQKLRTILYGVNNDCISDDANYFVRKFVLNMEMSSGKRRLNHVLANGQVEESVIDIISSERNIANSPPETPMEMQVREEMRREKNKLEQLKSFFYLPGGAESREKARGIVRDLLGTARTRCLLCDVFLSGNDVISFIPFVRMAHLPIRIISSSMFLRMKVSSSPKITQGKYLKDTIDNLQLSDKTIEITCRVLIGHNSPRVHDRFLLIDDNVYLLGSSINELGSRATTITRIPDPVSIRAAIENWWDDRSGETQSLNEWLSSRESDKEISV